MPKYEVVKDCVKVKYEDCDHCGSLPSESELLAAVKMATEEYGRRVCGVCGETQGIEELDIYHYKGADQDRWCSRATLLSPMLIFEDRTGATTIQLFMHPTCAVNAAPHVKWPFAPVAQKR